MAVTRTPKKLAAGQLPDTQGVLYTAPAGKTVYISRINLLNKNAATQTVVLYLNLSSTEVIHYRNAGFAQWYRYEDGPGIVLEAGDTIEAETTTASAVDYSIFGVEEVSS